MSVKSSRKSVSGKKGDNKSLARRNEDVRTFPSGTNSRLPDSDKLKFLNEVAAPHLGSFNYMLGDGLRYAMNDILPKGLLLGDRKVRIWFEDIKIHKPRRSDDTNYFEKPLMPAECRERGISYGANLTATICFELGENVVRLNKVLGQIPVMVKSDLCHIEGLGPAEMVKAKEDGTEFGGYFICNGIERVVRVLQIPRRNHMMAMLRSSYTKRGPKFTDQAVTMRCVGPDQVGKSVTLHYLRDGTVEVKVQIRKAEYFIPIMLLVKALRSPMATDKEIYTTVLRGAHLKGDTFVSDRVELSLQQIANLRLYTSEQCLAYLGMRFRAVLGDVAEYHTNIEAGRIFIDRHIFTHLNNYTAEYVNPAEREGFRFVGGLSDEQIGLEKFNLLLEMLRKLYAFVSGQISHDNADALCNHELLVGGHIIGSILKERLDMYLISLRATLRREFNMARSDAVRQELLNGDPKNFKKIIDRQADIGKKLFYFLATGNLVSESGLDLMQAAGYTIVAEKLNRYRFLSHFRSVHRGQFFTTMKTTAVRKLLPESWGFMCPVHTPDGSPCGLLNHLASMCTVVVNQPRNVNALNGYSDGAILAASQGEDSSIVRRKRSKSKSSKSGSSMGSTSLAPSLLTDTNSSSLLSPLANLIKNLTEWGVMPCGPRSNGVVPPFDFVPVMIDGRVVGYCEEDLLQKVIVPRLRRMKASALQLEAEEVKRRYSIFFPTSRALHKFAIDPHGFLAATLEVCFVPKQARGGYSGLYLFSAPGRMIRPVVNIETGMVELIGAMAQNFLEIAVKPEEVRIGVDSHCELWPTAMLSLIASLTPFSDFNQSPRNMYQCQMGKQTMGTPLHNYKFRTDNKLYRIQNPQAPVVQTAMQSVMSMDEYPNGTNAIVAVISYTGYDMEDAMIISKGSYDRGFGHGSVYKSKVIDLLEMGSNFVFTNIFPDSHKKWGLPIVPRLDLDGLPLVGERLENGTPIACYINEDTGEIKVEKYKDSEPCVIDQVRVLGTPGKSDHCIRKIRITLRYDRNPVVGDKFSSRHGQKGVLSILWPQEDMPFTESGMCPDVIINPHAFPSRMTIGMLIESMAGKAGALHGVYQDATPFTMQGDKEGETIVDYFGEQLRAAGYNYYGSEPLYSGLQGTEMQADIYIGLVYYQRLRHMVSDKSQVRSLGPIDAVTRQPVKGRKRMGGVRFGEMERDSLLAHGTSFLMRDRLLNCSDRHIAYVCCGSILAIHSKMSKNEAEDPTKLEEPSEKDLSSSVQVSKSDIVCNLCHRSDKWMAIVIPYVFRYLVNELAAMGIKIEIH